MKKHTLKVSNLSHPSTVRKVYDAMYRAFEKARSQNIGTSSVANKEDRPILFVTYNDTKGFRYYTASKREVGQAGGIEITDLIVKVLCKAQGTFPR